MSDFILDHFRKRDTKIYNYMERLGIDELRPSSPEMYFYNLCKSITYQQLSGRAAGTIFERLEELIGKEFTPIRVIELEHDAMRGVGLSNSKVLYIKNIAQAFFSGDIDPKQISKLEDEEVVRTLTRVKGIGIWTAEMFMISTLGRENIFSFGDLGLKKGIAKVYELDELPDQKVIGDIISKWSPYKTYGSLTLWKALDNI